MGSVYTASYQVTGATNGIVIGIFISGLFIRWINATVNIKICPSLFLKYTVGLLIDSRESK